MTLYDIEKREESIEIGIEKGIDRERRRQIERLFRKGKTSEEIVDLLDYSPELVKSVEGSVYSIKKFCYSYHRYVLAGDGPERAVAYPGVS